MTYRVLIVDDQREVSRLLKSALETIEQGLDVTEAPSGEEAILDATRKPVDLLIADFRLPGITGLELMRKFRTINPQVKIILITGISEPRLLAEVQNAGADAFFSKPVPMGDFLDAVERTLGMTRTILTRPEAQPAGPSQAEEPQDLGMSAVISGLRKDFSAQAVILLDAQGHIQAQAGELPDPDNTVSLIAALAGMSNTAQKAASLLEHGGDHLHLFSGQAVDGIFITVGQTHALLLIGKDLAKPQNLAENLDRLSTVCAQILGALNRLGLPLEPAASVEISSTSAEPLAAPENLPQEFLSIFNQLDKKSGEAEAFWESVVEKGTSYAEPDKLTYEQASKLGLTPDSPQKE